MNSSEQQQRGSKTLFGGAPRTEPGWLAWTLVALIRITFLTVIWTGLGMGAGLLLGLLAAMLRAALTHSLGDVDLAYRLVAIPLAALCGTGALLWNLVGTAKAAKQRMASR
jgi:hypothetical protein